ncbi:uncharacterized protein MAM_04578 [Metarhizium album ARSEF 1941]|uniref:Fungal N-terminal domain-containing protein n=1 Tax=Metarhizium album (strain ARSEF 1941) TaxID=1081103 RepID=A0A0B2WU23_METAS|nr:uncharacterized protein MAM_04578 [Metarhizium album ARSEF 1941]KHN97563.1 hypothetical protein MAM_04578 [Metarhizium album ARSEF 1941]
MEYITAASAAVSVVGGIASALGTVKKLASSMKEAGLEMVAMCEEVRALEALLKPLQKMRELQSGLAENLPSLLESCRSIAEDLEKLKREYLANSLEWARHGEERTASVQNRLRSCRNCLETTLQALEIDSWRSMKEAVGELRAQSNQRNTLCSAYPQAEPAGTPHGTHTGTQWLGTRAQTLRSTSTGGADEETTSPAAHVAGPRRARDGPVAGAQLMNSSSLCVLYASSGADSLDSAGLILRECHKTMQVLVELRCNHDHLVEDDHGVKSAVDGAILAFQEALRGAKEVVELCASDSTGGRRSVRKMTRWVIQGKHTFKRHLPQLLDKNDKALHEISVLRTMAESAQRPGGGAADIHQQRETADKREAEGFERLRTAMGG